MVFLHSMWTLNTFSTFYTAISCAQPVVQACGHWALAHHGRRNPNEKHKACSFNFAILQPVAPSIRIPDQNVWSWKKCNPNLENAAKHHSAYTIIDCFAALHFCTSFKSALKHRLLCQIGGISGLEHFFKVNWCWEANQGPIWACRRVSLCKPDHAHIQ